MLKLTFCVETLRKNKSIGETAKFSIANADNFYDEMNAYAGT